MSVERLTLVIESYRKNRHNHRLLFGDPARTIRRGWRRRMAVFAPGQLFGYERWSANAYGTQHWSIVVCWTCSKAPLTRLPGIVPGADVWLHARGQTRVKRVFAALDALREAELTPEQVPERCWRALHMAVVLNTNPTALVEDWAC